MFSRSYLVIVFVFLVLSLAVRSEEKDPAKLFELANIEMDRGNLRESLSLFQQVESIYSGDPSTVWNIGTLALILEDYQLARESWSQMRKLEPNEWRILTKLAQANKGLGDIEAFNDYREELVALHKSGKDKDLNNQNRFLVEQMPLGQGKLYIYQYFSPLSVDLAIFYEAVLINEKNVVQVRTSMGSYKSTNEIHQSIEGNTDSRLYHFDLYENDGSHRLLGMLPSEQEITYSRATPALIDAIKKWNE